MPSDGPPLMDESARLVTPTKTCQWCNGRGWTCPECSDPDCADVEQCPKCDGTGKAPDA